MNVDQMLQKITWKQFKIWQAFAQLEPFGDRWMDVRFASLCALLANINRDTKRRSQPFTIEDFLLTPKEGKVTAQKTGRRKRLSKADEQLRILKMMFGLTPDVLKEIEKQDG